MLRPLAIPRAKYSFSQYRRAPRAFVQLRAGVSSSSTRYSAANATSSTPPVDTRASAKLWADAAEEEKAFITTNSHVDRYRQQQQEYPNWTGDEEIRDAVLRMLVDKYKPLRTGTGLRSADEKMADEKARVLPDIQAEGGVDTDTIHVDSVIVASVSTPVDPATHRPWHTTFQAPTHASIRQMRLPPLPPVRPSNGATSVAEIAADDTRARNLERDRKRKAAQAGRLTNAKQGSLDYRLGNLGEKSQSFRLNPVTVKGWKSLVEERIEQARNEGHFRTIKGRGKPLSRDTEHSNPFIAREEFLMNRIVQRQGAAPPWVEYQAELETAVSTFRRTLRTTWVRRAVRNLITSYPKEYLATLTLSNMSTRDKEWEKREEGYHTEAVEDVNRLVRRYNGVAPYAVRRPYMDLQVELDKMYEECREEILEETQRRGLMGQGKETLGASGWNDKDEWGGEGTDNAATIDPKHKKTTGWKFSEWWDRMVGKFVA